MASLEKRSNLNWIENLNSKYVFHRRCQAWYLKESLSTRGQTTTKNPQLIYWCPKCKQRFTGNRRGAPSWDSLTVDREVMQ